MLTVISCAGGRCSRSCSVAVASGAVRVASRRVRGRANDMGHDRTSSRTTRGPGEGAARGVGNLATRKMYKAMRDATITAALREWFRIVHISLQKTHIHLIVEAND